MILDCILSPLYFHHRVHWLLRKYEWPDDWANEDDGAEVQQDVFPKKYGGTGEVNGRSPGS